MNKRLKIFEVKSEYIQYLSNYQKHLFDINKEKDMSYRYLLQAESREINRQKNRLRKNAEIVYRILRKQ